MSYTRFEFSQLRIEPQQVAPDGQVRIQVDVRNVSDRAGDEVIQLYIHDVLSSMTRPVKELKGVKRITLRPGEQKTVTFTLAASQLGFYNRDMALVVEPGTIEVMVGSSSEDIRLAGEFEITGAVTEVRPDRVFFSLVKMQ